MNAIPPDHGILTADSVADRKALFGIGHDEETRLAAWRPRVLTRLDEVVAAFYDYQMSIPEIRRLIGEPETLDRLKRSARSYILDLFGGPYDVDYVGARLRIGLVHKRIGVPPRLYLSAFSALHGLLDTLLREEARTDDGLPDLEVTRSALRKVLMFDMELVFDTYIESLMGEVESARKEIQLYADELERNVAELSELSRRDPLTNLLNHRAFIEELRREIARSEREGMTLSLAYIDLNGFKEVNDLQGHQRGDRILQDVAAIFVDGTRSSDIAFRYGGDEFSIILPKCTIAQARLVCEKVIAVMEERQVKDVSLSIGIAESSPQARTTMDALISAADTAMYRAKDLSRRYPGSHIVLAPGPVER